MADGKERRESGYRISRRSFVNSVGTTALAAGAGGITSSPSAAAVPVKKKAARDRVVDIGDWNQVFIDGRYLARVKGARIAVFPPAKTHEECLLTSRFPKPPYGTILPTDGTFRGFSALTKDGIHWRVVKRGTKPADDDLLGYINYGKSMVFNDPSCDAQTRYKWFTPNSVKASSKGVEWEKIATRMFPAQAYFPHGMDTHNICFYDTRLDKYVSYVRVNKTYQSSQSDETYRCRAIGRSETGDLAQFPMPQVVFEKDANDPHFGGESVLDFYTPHVIQYDRAQEAYFLFTARYRHYRPSYLADDLSVYPKSGANTGPLDIGFAASRDGIHWRRYDRKPWIPLGLEETFDSKLMYMVYGMFFHDDEIWMYYTGSHAVHGHVGLRPDKSDPPKYGHPTMSRVVLTTDRFTGVEADYTGGEFTTPPLRFAGDSLHLNINTSAVGLARVEVQGLSGTPIDGYRLDDCERIHTANTTDRLVRWRKGQTNVAPLASKPIRLRFELQYGATLHAFRFGR